MELVASASGCSTHWRGAACNLEWLGFEHLAHRTRSKVSVTMKVPGLPRVASGENAMYGAYLHLPRSLALYRVATGALSGRLRLRRIVRVRADSDKSFREMLFKPRGALFLFVGRGGSCAAANPACGVGLAP